MKDILVVNKLFIWFSLKQAVGSDRGRHTASDVPEALRIPNSLLHYGMSSTYMFLRLYNGDCFFLKKAEYVTALWKHLPSLSLEQQDWYLM